MQMRRNTLFLRIFIFFQNLFLALAARSWYTCRKSFWGGTTLETLFGSIITLFINSVLGAVPVNVLTLAAAHTVREMRNALAELFLITAVLFLLAVIITLYKLLSRSKRIKTSVVVFIYVAGILVLMTTLACTYVYRLASGVPVLQELIYMYL